MKKFYLFICTAFTFSNTSAQSVSISPDGSPPTDPKAMLEIKKAGYSKLKVKSEDFVDTTVIELSNKDSDITGTSFKLSSIREEGLFISSESDLPGNTRPDLLSIIPQSGGRIGVGTRSPIFKLDVRGGDINTTGALRINSDPGIAGQVLTSNGTGAPGWENASFGNNIRFSFRFSTTGTTPSLDSLEFNSTIYNLNPSMVSIMANNSRILFNKTGLYHIEGTIYLELSSGANLNYQPQVNLDYYLDNVSRQLESVVLNNSFAALPTTAFNRTHKFSFDVHITAGQSLKLTRFFNGTAGSHFTLGNIQGYLISE